MNAIAATFLTTGSICSISPPLSLLASRSDTIEGSKFPVFCKWSETGKSVAKRVGIPLCFVRPQWVCPVKGPVGHGSTLPIS